MRKVKVLFFAADPLSIGSDGSTPRLLLDEEVRQVRKRVNASVFGNMLEFDWRLAARTRDLQQALEETRPVIVHFSGHGESSGLVLAGADGRTPRRVDTGVLRELFEKDAASIRLVVLTACNSLPQAEAVKEVVGCAIGARDRISDDAAITFNAKFYSALASGRSVQDAFERARMALRLEHPAEGDILQLLQRDNSAKLVFVSRLRRYARFGMAGAAALVLSFSALITWRTDAPGDPSNPRGVRLGDCSFTGTAPMALLSEAAAASADPSGPSTAETELEEAKALCRTGNYDSAVAHFKLASEGGDTEAMAFLAIAYLSGQGIAPDTQKAMHLLEDAAKTKRNPAAMNLLGIVYENDRHMSRRLYLAGHWYEEAAKKGYAEGMRNLARLYRSGLGVVRSDSLALWWLRQAVAAGSKDALVDLGRIYEEGVAGRVDIRRALQFYDSAAAAGSALGMYTMGRMYEEGVGMRVDYRKAGAWYLRGACHGSAEAMNNLGVLYEKGLGVRADRGEAIRWFRLGVEAGSRVAAANLARLEEARPRALGWLSRSESRTPPACGRLLQASSATDTAPRPMDT